MCVTIDGGLDWILYLLTTLQHHSEVHVITAPSLISTIYRSLQRTPFPACCVFTSRSLATTSNSGDSSASALKFSLNGGSLPSLSTVCYLSLTLFRLPYRTDLVAPVVFLLTPRHAPRRQHRSFSYANSFQGNVLTEPFSSIGRLFLSIRNLLPSVVCFAAVA
jgi:hypothetical protein